AQSPAGGGAGGDDQVRVQGKRIPQEGPRRACRRAAFAAGRNQDSLEAAADAAAVFAAGTALETVPTGSGGLFISRDRHGIRDSHAPEASPRAIWYLNTTSKSLIE